MAEDDRHAQLLLEVQTANANNLKLNRRLEDSVLQEITKVKNEILLSNARVEESHAELKRTLSTVILKLELSSANETSDHQETDAKLGTVIRKLKQPATGLFGKLVEIAQWLIHL